MMPIGFDVDEGKDAKALNESNEFYNDNEIKLEL
jgi:hypothetical protein